MAISTNLPRASGFKDTRARPLFPLLIASLVFLGSSCATNDLKDVTEGGCRGAISETTPAETAPAETAPTELHITEEKKPETEWGVEKEGKDIERIVGFQVLLFSSKTKEGLVEEMSKIREAGADTVIVRVFHNRGDRFYPFVEPGADSGVYFRTRHAPVVADALTPMITAARANGLSIYAWMTTKYAVYGRSENNLYSYDFESKKIVPSLGVDIFDDREVTRLVNIYEDLARYDIDGILFQDDLILRHAEGMGDGASRLYGNKIRPESLYVSPYLNSAGTKYYVREYTDEFWRWSSFKSRRLALVAKRIMAGARGINPRLRFAVNLSYESAIRPDLALAWFSQDIGEFKTDKNGEGVDYFFIMAYHRQMMREKSYNDLKQVAPLINNVCNNAVFIVGRPERLVIKLQVTDWKTDAPIAEGELLKVASYLCRIDEISIAFVPFRIDAPLKDVKNVVRMSDR
ncbi:MAG: hypothetical protein JW984_04360 [Deltaproteobacteria bacterium]|uniref:Poly-beta-1,6-N-acetyl-D-glucosamine N-deacetylase PgaB C-terminal domain-containing protein n=1 Tax=Candidatus Zymogenus saltonus TaxID=2844893 RepID=A0A9D8KEV2_9DELT|nr:hypothetical protein [Candidatus Zymogenus saltonus]